MIIKNFKSSAIRKNKFHIQNCQNRVIGFTIFSNTKKNK